MIDKVTNDVCNNTFQDVTLKNSSDQLVNSSSNKATSNQVLKNKYLNSSTENSEFVEKIQQEIEQAKSIAIKMIKGERITSAERRFINNRYPDIKQITEETIQECNELKDIMKSCSSQNEIQKVLSRYIEDINKNMKLGKLSDIQAKIKLFAANELSKYAKNIAKEFSKIEYISLKMLHGKKLTSSEQKLVNEKYPEIKNIVKEALRDSKAVKLKLDSYNTNTEKSRVLARIVDSLKESIEDGSDNISINYKNTKGILSKVESTVKIASMMDIEKVLKEEEKEMKKVTQIALKIVRENKLLRSEEIFINNKYPKEKNFAEKLLTEFHNLKKNIAICTSDTDKNKLLMDKIKYIENLHDDQIQDKISILLKKQLINRIEEYGKNNYNDDYMKYYLNPIIYVLYRGISSNVEIIVILIIIIGAILFFT